MKTELPTNHIPNTEPDKKKPNAYCRTRGTSLHLICIDTVQRLLKPYELVKQMLLSISWLTRPITFGL